MAFVPSYQQGPIPLGDWTNLFQSFGYAADGITNEFPWMGFRIVEWDQNGKVSAQSIHQYGSAVNDKNSKFYNNQSHLFSSKKTIEDLFLKIRNEI